MLPKIVKFADGGPELTRAYACANAAGNDAIAAGDFTMIDASGNLVIYADGSNTQVAGIAEPYLDTGAPLNGIVPVTPLDLSGQYVMGAYGPTTATERRRIAVLKAGDTLRMATQANTDGNTVGDAVGFIGTTGAFYADQDATGKVGIITKVELAQTASTDGVVLVTMTSAGVNPGA